MQACGEREHGVADRSREAHPFTGHRASVDELAGADDLIQAIQKATAITNSRPPKAEENTVRLLEELDADVRVIGVRPVEVVRNAPKP